MTELVCEFDDQNAVLRHQPDQHDETDLRIDVERNAGEKQRQHRRRQGERHGEQDDQGAADAFELSDQHQKHDYQREEVGQQNLVRCLSQTFGIALQQHVDVRSDGVAGQSLDLLNRLLQGHAGGNGRFDLDGPALGSAVELGRDAFLDDLRHAG